MSRKTTTIALAVLALLGFTNALALQLPAASAPPSPAVPADFVVGPGDVLGVLFWREADLSGDVTVRPDGRITLPVVGEFVAAGRRPDDLQKEILEASSKYITDANVTVVVRTINSRRIFITGRVTTPGTHPLVGPLTVLQAIALAGGLTEYADSKGITILRNEQGAMRTFKFNYRDVIKGRRLEQNIQLHPGDTIVVP